MAIEVAEKRIDEIEAQLKDRMREAVRAILPGWVITWKADKTGKRSLRIKRDTRR
jgi:predicted phage-related endonuclease